MDDSDRTQTDASLVSREWIMSHLTKTCSWTEERFSQNCFQQSAANWTYAIALENVDKQWVISAFDVQNENLTLETMFLDANGRGLVWQNFTGKRPSAAAIRSPVQGKHGNMYVGRLKGIIGMVATPNPGRYIFYTKNNDEIVDTGFEVLCVA